MTITSLPTEILWRIFNLSMKVSHWSNMRGSTPEPEFKWDLETLSCDLDPVKPLTLTKVCRQWEYAVGEMRHLWKECVIANCSDAPLSMIRICLENQYGFPLRETY